MQNQIKGLLRAMKVKEDREHAEECALKIVAAGAEAFEFLTAYGRRLMQKDQDEITKNKIRAVVFTLSVFNRSTRAGFDGLPGHKDAVALLMDLAFMGFQSAAMLLSDLGITQNDIYRKKLLELPLVAPHSHDREISLNEAVEEIRLSKTYSGSKGLRKDHYALGRDTKRGYDIIRIDKKTFAVRTKKSV